MATAIDSDISHVAGHDDDHKSAIQNTSGGGTQEHASGSTNETGDANHHDKDRHTEGERQ